MAKLYKRLYEEPNRTFLYESSQKRVSRLLPADLDGIVGVTGAVPV